MTTTLTLPKPDADGVYRPYPRPAGARLVSYSELKSLDCWLKHHLTYVERLKPRETFAALQLGRVWDEFMNEWHAPFWSADRDVVGHPVHERDRMDVALQAAAAELEREARRVDGVLVDKDLPQPLDWNEQMCGIAITIYKMAENYVARYGDDADWQTLAVQMKFEVPFPSQSGSGRASSKYWLHGVIDRVGVHLPTGRVYIIDAKLRMSTLNEAYREGFDNDLQLPLYGWALTQLGLRCEGGLIDAASTAVPSWPLLRQKPEPVIDPVTGEKVTEPIPCEPCDGSGGHTADVPGVCEACDGEGITRGRPVQSVDPTTGEPMVRPILDDAGQPVTFASGKRAGEVKTEKVMEPGPIKTRVVTRPALYSDAHVNTTLPMYLAALDEYGIPHTQYPEQIAQLEAEWTGVLPSPFHWRTDAEGSIYTDAELERAIGTMKYVGPLLDKLPPAPMPSAQKCRFCSVRMLCPVADPTVIAEHFTTPAQREAARVAQDAERARQEADADQWGDVIVPSGADALDEAFASIV